MHQTRSGPIELQDASTRAWPMSLLRYRFRMRRTKDLSTRINERLKPDTSSEPLTEMTCGEHPVRLSNVCVIIPVVRDHEPLRLLLEDLRRGEFGQLIVSSGDDSTYEFGSNNLVELVQAARGRGPQISHAISQAQSEWIWILHADVRVSRQVLEALRDALPRAAWGGFRIQLIGRSPFLRAIARMMNWRSQLTSIYTGDQGMFMRRDLLETADGFLPIALMEDIECSRRLKRLTRGRQLKQTLAVSARKWEREGVVLTVFRMWWYRFCYFFGADPSRLSKRYYRPNRSQTSS